MGFAGHRPPRGFSILVLAVVLGLSALALSQCRVVDDTITGVDLKSAGTLHGKSDCAHACNDLYKGCRRKEDARHKDAVRACKKEKTSAKRSACRKDEQRRHHAEHLACVRAKNECKKNCYNEGSGGGGR